MPQYVTGVSNMFEECEFCFLHVTDDFLLHVIKLYAEQVSIIVRCVPPASESTTRWQYWVIYLLGGGYTWYTPVYPLSDMPIPGIPTSGLFKALVYPLLSGIPISHL